MTIKGYGVCGHRGLFTMFSLKSVLLALFLSSFIFAPTAVAVAPEISSTSTIANGALDPATIVISTAFASDNDKFDFTVDMGTTGLEYDSAAFINDSRMRLNLHGTAKAGSIVITANGSAFNPANAASSNEITITVPVPMINQMIAFSPLASMVVGGADQMPVATASSGLEVSISSNTPSVCTIDFGKIHAVSAGTCSIKALQSGDYQFNPAANLTRTLTITSNSVPVSAAIVKPEVATELGSMSYDPKNSDSGYKSILVTNPEFDHAILLKLRVPAEATPSKTVFLVSTFSSAKENAAGYFTARIVGVTSDGIAVRKLNEAIEINIPFGAADALPYWSHDGKRWYQLKKLDSKKLSSNLHTGFFIDDDARIAILTDYLMLFGLRKPQLPMTILSPVTRLSARTTAALQTSGGSGDGALDFRTSTSEICSVSAQGVVKGLSAGLCLIIATKAASTNFADARSGELSLKITGEAMPTREVAPPLTTGIFDGSLLAHSLASMISNGQKIIEVSLSSIYAGKLAKMNWGTKSKTGTWVWTEISSATLDANGVAKFLLESIIPTTGRVRVLVNGVIQMESNL